MRRRTSIRFYIGVIIFSILAVSAEIFLLSTMSNSTLPLFIASAINFLLSVIFLMISYDFKPIFIFTFIEIIAISIYALYVYIDSDYFALSSKQFLMIAINFFIPAICCLILELLDTSKKYHHYRKFAINSIILFLIYYIGVLIYVDFLSLPPLKLALRPQNRIPFYTVAGYIEDYIYKVGSMNTILSHLLPPILLYVPTGYLLGILLRHKNRFLRLLLLLFLPAMFELIQMFTKVAYFNVDDIIYGFLGGILGQIIFFVVNAIHLWLKNSEYLTNDDLGYSSLRF